MKLRRHGAYLMPAALLAALAVTGARAAPQPAGPDAQAATSLLVQELQQGDAALARKDYALALDLYRRAAAQNNAKAQIKVAALYAAGLGVAQDYAEAMQWYQKAAAQNDAEAQGAIGVMYVLGWGVAQDYAQAMQWFQKAAAQGDAGAEVNLGHLYADGSGTKQDYGQAMQWFQKAAAHGSAEAEARIGYMYQEGAGVAKDNVQALQWYQKAADHGFARAGFLIGFLHDRGGAGMTKDYGQAMEWYRKASARNVAEAEFYMGLHYEAGAGVDPDLDQARQWFQKAIAHGSQDARKEMAVLQSGPAKAQAGSGRVAQSAKGDTAPDGPLEPIAATHTLPPYPLLSQKLEEEGVSALLVHIQTNGSVDTCAVISSSGSVLLDRAACTHVQAQWRWRPPVVQGKPQAVSTKVNISWDLREADQE